MIPNTAESSHSLDTLIIFECNDTRQDTGLIFLKRNKSDENKFELHLHNDYTNQAIVIVLDIKDLVKIFE